MVISPDTFRNAAHRVNGWRRPLLLTHVRPDGDAVGCVIAMRSILRSCGAAPVSLLLSPAPRRYESLWEGEPVSCSDAPGQAATAASADGVIILDTCSYTQLEPIADWLRSGPGEQLPKLVVDHHLTRDDLADEYLIDTSAAAAALLLFEWAVAVEWPIDRAAANALFAGIATDTGWFSYSNTDSRALAAAAHLVERGAEPSALNEHLHHNDRPEQLRLAAAAMSTLELHHDGRVAIMALEPSHFRSAGATPGDTEDLVNEPMRVRGVWASALLVVQEPNLVRVSFRSKPPADSRPDVNVADIAAVFGGGGHSRAAGARVPGSVETVKSLVLAKLEEACGP